MNLTQAQKDALAAGASMEEVLAMAAAPAVEEDDKGTKADATDPNKGAEGDDAVAALAAAQTTITELQAEAVTQTEALATAQAAQATAEAALAEANAQVTAMADALRPYVAKMGMIMGSGVKATALTAPQVLAEHAKLYPEFAEKFRPGKQSKTANVEADKKAEADADFQHRMLKNASAFSNL